MEMISSGCSEVTQRTTENLNFGNRRSALERGKKPQHLTHVAEMTSNSYPKSVERFSPSFERHNQSLKFKNMENEE